MIRKLVLAAVVITILAVLAAGPAFADNPGTTGQPGASCQVTTVTPGNAASAPGSAFNPDGTAGKVYAGQQTQNSSNPVSVSQYDVACFQNTQPHP